MSLTLEKRLCRLTEELRMLSGLSVSFGTAKESRTIRFGLAQEAVLREGRFVPEPRPITESSLFDLASLTKLFTAVCMLQLIERGKLGFDDSVGGLDPRFSCLKKISVYELLTYQVPLRSPERVDAQPDGDAAERQIFACAPAPGPEPEKLYSDMNALICRYLVESVSGLSFEAYLGKYIFSPLGLRNTFAKVPEDRLKDCLNYNYEHRVINGRWLLSEQVTPGLPHDPKARLLLKTGKGLSGHAGLFSTAEDMVRFAQGLLEGAILSRETLLEIGKNRTGTTAGRYRQYLGYLCFAKSAVRRLSEVPPWMGERALGLSGYTGNHLAIDPELGAFDLLLGNRCHMRVSAIEPPEAAEAFGLSKEGAGLIRWPDGRLVYSSFRYVYQKDNLIHLPAYEGMRALGWIGL